MAAAGSEQKELLALMHQHLVQIGYGKAAKELLLQSGQKNFPSSPVPLRDIFIQWKKTSSQTPKRKADDTERDMPTKIRVPDPKSSSESEEEEQVAKPVITKLFVNNSSTPKAESSSEDEDSSSEEEAVAGKVVKTTVQGKKTAHFLQLAAQKTNSVPGKGVAVASVQAKGKPNKAISSKPPPQGVAKTGQNKVILGKSGPPVTAGQSLIQAAAAKKSVDSEKSSSTSDSEEEKTLTVLKHPPPKQALEKAESSSEDSSDDSDSEEAATVQVKPPVQTAQVNTTPAKSSLATITPSKGPAIKTTPTKTTANQSRLGFGNAAGSAKPSDSSETSESSDSDDEPPSVAQAKSSGKTPPSSTTPVKNAPSALLSKAVSVPSPLKQTPKLSVTSSPNLRLQPPAKAVRSAKKPESSESSESSESENEAPLVPISQKRLQTPQPPTGAKQNQADKPGPPINAASSALKKKTTESESSSSSDSEDETVPAAQNLPPPSTNKVNAAAQLTSVKKPQVPQAPLQKVQESEDSSQDSSDESDSEEDTVFTQKPAQVMQKPAPVPVKALAAKTSGKAGNAQSTGKGIASPAKLSATASLQKAPVSSETDSSDSSEDGKPVKQPPIHPFFKQKITSGKAAIPSGRGLQANSSASDSVSSKSQAGIPQKQGAINRAESSSEESSEEDQEPSQSLFGYQSTKISTPVVPKSPVSLLSKQSAGKVVPTTGTSVIHALEKTSGKVAPADSSSSDSSDSDTDAEETSTRQKAETGSLPSSGKEAVVAKGTVAGKGAPKTRAPPAKKATAKAQSNGKAKRAAAAQLPLTLLSTPRPEGIGSASTRGGEAVGQAPGAGARGGMQATPVVAAKTPKTTKPSKAGVKEKQPKKRKQAAGKASLGEPKEKKLKVQSDLEVSKKKKSKSSSSTKSPKKKDKEKKSKKKKSKKLESQISDGSEKKKKKKKKTDSLEGAA